MSDARTELRAYAPAFLEVIEQLETRLEAFRDVVSERFRKLESHEHSVSFGDERGTMDMPAYYRSVDRRLNELETRAHVHANAGAATRFDDPTVQLRRDTSRLVRAARAVVRDHGSLDRWDISLLWELDAAAKLFDQDVPLEAPVLLTQPMYGASIVGITEAERRNTMAQLGDECARNGCPTCYPDPPKEKL